MNVHWLFYQTRKCYLCAEHVCTVIIAGNEFMGVKFIDIVVSGLILGIVGTLVITFVAHHFTIGG